MLSLLHLFSHSFLVLCSLVVRMLGQDSTGAIALDPKDRFCIETKPHGHGDVHALMYSSKTAEIWAKDGCKWVVFMQV